MAKQQRAATYDHALLLRDAGAVTASAAAQVSAAAKVLDLGAGRVAGVVMLDISAMDVTSGDEKYELEAQYSNDATFATGVVVGQVAKLGDSTTTGSSADSTTGRYELPVVNEINGTRYRYMRLFQRIAGTTPSINFVGYLTKW